MVTITEFLAAEHRGCDDRFAAAEDAAHAGDLARCRADFQRFRTAMEDHIQKEEALLFPAFEQASGNAAGPTRVMRLEHRQMREVFIGMEHALADGDLAEFLGQAETLLILMQQHSIKEEQILYPMCDRFLGNAVESVIRAMQDLPKG
jgi:iron-sulfur cluster repair protein YtfE (RIC family)